jgi:hypothetical protein
MFRRWMLRSSVVAACALLWTATASAQTVNIGGNATLTFKGFISVTAFAQDQNFTFGNGQNAEWPTPPEFTTDRWFGGGDVRNTRLTMVFDGPKVVGDFKVGATLETDFFGGFNGTGAFSQQQATPRLRLAYADLSNGATTFRIGQQWTPLFGNVPVSLSHIAFPLSYGAGMPGWRFPGISVIQKLTDKSSSVQSDVQFSVLEGSWNGPGDNVNFGTAGNAGFPQLEGRVNVSGKLDNGSWGAYVVGHFDNKDLSGANAAKAHDSLKGYGAEVGAKLQMGPVLVQGNYYWGKAMGQQFEAITQFGDIESMGAWLQVGFDITKNWSIFGFGAVDNPKDADVLAAVAPASARLKNEMAAGMVRWKAGPFALGFEFLWSQLTSGPTELKTTGHQIALSALYSF